MTPQQEVRPDSLAGRTALVTGAGSGIGRACAHHLADRGARVVVADLNADACEAVAAETGGEAVIADLSDLDQCADLGRYAPDILVNNAGSQHVAPLTEFPPETFSTMLRVMVEAPFRIAREALPAMYQRSWGRVINVS